MYQKAFVHINTLNFMVYENLNIQMYTDVHTIQMYSFVCMYYAVAPYL